MNLVITIFIAGLFVGLGYFLLRYQAKRRGKQHPAVLNVVLPDSNYKEENYYNSHGRELNDGVTVRTYDDDNGVRVDVPQVVLDAIEEGIAHQIRNSSAARPSWTQFRNIKDYEVYLVKPHTHNVETDPGSPALLVNYSDAAGNQLKLQSAGTCIGVGGAVLFGGTDTRYPAIVMPYEPGEEVEHLTYIRETARNESEHLAEWMNDRQMFASFAIVGDVHPHFPDE